MGSAASVLADSWPAGNYCATARAHGISVVRRTGAARHGCATPPGGRRRASRTCSEAKRQHFRIVCVCIRVHGGGGGSIREGQVDDWGCNRCPFGAPAMIAAAHLWAIGYDDMARANQVRDESRGWDGRAPRSAGISSSTTSQWSCGIRTGPLSAAPVALPWLPRPVSATISCGRLRG
jgi:hypothetical protein